VVVGGTARRRLHADAQLVAVLDIGAVAQVDARREWRRGRRRGSLAHCRCRLRDRAGIANAARPLAKPVVIPELLLEEERLALLHGVGARLIAPLVGREHVVAWSKPAVGFLRRRRRGGWHLRARAPDDMIGRERVALLGCVAALSALLELAVSRNEVVLVAFAGQQFVAPLLITRELQVFAATIVGEAAARERVPGAWLERRLERRGRCGRRHRGLAMH